MRGAERAVHLRTLCFFKLLSGSRSSCDAVALRGKCIAPTEDTPANQSAFIMETA